MILHCYIYSETLLLLIFLILIHLIVNQSRLEGLRMLKLHYLQLRDGVSCSRKRRLLMSIVIDGKKKIRRSVIVEMLEAPQVLKKKLTGLKGQKID